MEYFVPVFVFLFGTLVGSFLNVVIFRHNTGRDFGGRSGCLTCGKQLAWYELVPILSYLFQRGRCRKCDAQVSVLYPLTEFLMGGIFLMLFSRFIFFLPGALGNFVYFVSFYGTVFALLLVISGYDLRHKIIPDTLSYPLIAIAFIGLFLSDYGVVHLHIPSLLSVLSGFFVALPLFILFAITRGRGIGFGDVKLAIAMGLLLGASRGFAALILAFWIGAVVGLFLLLDRKKNTTGMKTEVPFAPFLVLGTIITFFFDIHFMGLMSLFAF